MNVKIEIEVGGKKLKLSPDEVEELRRELNKAAPAPNYYPYYPHWWNTRWDGSGWITYTSADLTSGDVTTTNWRDSTVRLINEKFAPDVS